MCIKDNNADHAEFFINAQLKALWTIAAECAEAYSSSDKRSLSVSGYDYVLAEYYAPTYFVTPAPKVNHGWLTSTKAPRSPLKCNSVFHATFTEPTIEFVCAHELVYHLNIHSSTVTGIQPTRA